MITTDKLPRPTGTLHLVAKNKQGVEMWRVSARNLIVNSGYNAMAQALSGVPDMHIHKIGIGTNGTAPKETDTQLTDAVLFDIESVEYPTPSSVRFNFTIGYSDAGGVSIREFGLLCADGRLFSRKTREAIEKTQHMTIAGMWEINM